MKTSVKNTLTSLFLLFTCVGCDQATKILARRHLVGKGPIRLLHDSVRLQYAENPGAFLSLGAGLPANLRHTIFILLIGALLLGALIYLLKGSRTDLGGALSLALVVAGGCGNLLDRIFNQGRVIDFLNLGIGPLRTGIFNLADVVISIGVLWLVLRSYRRHHSLP